MTPLEIINGPLSLYWAPVGEAFPAVDAAPVGNWALIGTSGANNYTEDGVTLAFNKSIEVFRGLGTTFPLKAFVTETDVFVRVEMADLSLTQFRQAMNLNAVNVDAGPPEIEDINLDIGADPNDLALLVRGVSKSPQFLTGNLQFELNRVIETASHELSFVKGEPVGVNLEFQVLLDSAGAVGRIVVQTA